MVIYKIYLYITIMFYNNINIIYILVVVAFILLNIKINIRPVV